MDDRARPAPLSRPEAYPKAGRILRRRDYQKVYREGRRHQGRLVIVFAHKRAATGWRLGVTATKRIGGSVVRNLLKRRVREIWRTQAKSPMPFGFDVIVNLTDRAVAAPYAALAEELSRLIRDAARMSA